MLHVDDNLLETIWYEDGEETMPVDTKKKSKGPSEGRDTVQSRVWTGINIKAVALCRQTWTEKSMAQNDPIFWKYL